jgi:hypothetical protein
MRICRIDDASAENAGLAQVVHISSLSGLGAMLRRSETPHQDSTQVEVLKAIPTSGDFAAKDGCVRCLVRIAM